MRTRRSDGSHVTYERDTLGRVLKQTFNDTLSESFAYDAAGNLTTATFLGGRRYGFTYDPHGQLLADSLSSGTQCCEHLSKSPYSRA
jgi:YD repeat-containing protein